MSDIQEEQKRLYKRAEENDKKYNKYLQKELAEANNRIYKAIIYMQNYINVEDSMMCESAREEFKEIINILQGKE